MSGWSAITVIALLTLAVTAGYVLVRWRRSPAAFRAIYAVGAAGMAAGFLLGLATHHAVGVHTLRAAPAVSTPLAAAGVVPAKVSADAAAALQRLGTRHEFSARVTAIVDGDTVDVVAADGAYHAIRLAGIDAPEHGQAFGRRSTEHLAALIAGRTVALDCEPDLSDGRMICKVLLPGGEDVDLDQVRAGMAWHYKQYEDGQSSADRQAYSAAECAAMKAHVGLWSDPHPTEPQDFRHHTRSPLLLGADGCRITSEPASGAVIGNARTRIFEWPYYGAISPSNRVQFASPQAAEAAGYRAAHDCP